MSYTPINYTMKTVFLVVLIASNFCIETSTKGLDLRRHVILNYVGNCPKKNNLSVVIGNFSIDQIGKSEYVANGQFEVTSNFPEGFKGKLITKLKIKSNFCKIYSSF